MADEKSFKQEFYHPIGFSGRYCRWYYGICAEKANTFYCHHHTGRYRLEGEIFCVFDFSVNWDFTQRIFCSEIFEGEKDGAWNHPHHLCHQSEGESIGPK